MKILVPFLILVSSQAMAQDELSQRIAAFERCLSDAARQLDDGTSPAQQLGRVVAGECLSEWERFLRLTADGALPRRAQALSEYPTPRALDMATKAVLLERRAKK